MWIVLAAALFLPDGSAIARGATADVTDRQSHTVALPQGKAVTIELTVGSVRLEGWDRADTAELTIERRAPAAAQFARLPLQFEDTPSRIVIRALQIDEGTDPALTTAIVLRVPRTALIERISILEGKLSMSGFSGSLTGDVRRGPIDGQHVSGILRLSCEIGSITLTAARLSDNGLLRLRSFNGDVRLTLAERPANARILALALNGHIKSEIPLRVKDSWGPRWGEATLGSGEPLISIDVVTGTIEIKSPES